MVEMYLHYRESYKREGALGSPRWKPIYDWYEITELDHISENFTIGKCIRLGRNTSNVWVLYHTETLQTICIGTKGNMRKLAKEMKSYSFDGVSTWKRGSSTIRSLTKLVESIS
jgi:hypothetical protein